MLHPELIAASLHRQSQRGFLLLASVQSDMVPALNQAHASLKSNYSSPAQQGIGQGQERCNGGRYQEHPVVPRAAQGRQMSGSQQKVPR